ncbi:MAG: diacylglycerol kinase family protein [Patescibacteria group bacterium]|nr:diacylglycerol kinase family protein [Patescibacteria group bacterium]
MKNKNILQSFNCAFQGLKHIFYTHKHFKWQILIGLLVLIFCFLIKISYLEWIFIILSIIFVLFSEVLNTIIEEISNIITQEYHSKIKIIKDMSGSLVLISVIFSVIIFFMIIINKILFFL